MNDNHHDAGHSVSSAPVLVHDADEELYEYRDVDRAVLHYRIAGPRVVLEHIDVPDSLRGRGIADRLVAAAVDDALAAGRAVTPVCPQARHWLLARPELWAGLSVDWTQVQSDQPEAPSAYDPRW